jgi:hypothetical protein
VSNRPGLLLFLAIDCACGQNYNTGHVFGFVTTKRGADGSCEQSVNKALNGIPVVAWQGGKPSLTIVREGRFDFLALQVFGESYQVKAQLRGFRQASTNIAAPRANQAVTVFEPYICLEPAPPPGAASLRRRGRVFFLQVSQGGRDEPPAPPRKLFAGTIRTAAGAPARARVSLFGVAEDGQSLVPVTSAESDARGRYELRLNAASKSFAGYALTAENPRVGSAFAFAPLDANNAASAPPLVLHASSPGPENVESVETSSATRSTLFFGRELVALPASGSRSFDSFALLAPGVFPSPQANGTAGPGLSPGLGAAGQFSVNGLRSRENNFVVDGVDNNDEEVGSRRQGFLVLAPLTLESTQQFQVLTALADARFGRAIGGQVNALSSSGLSALHGELYGIFSDERANARNFFDAGPRGSVPDTRSTSGFAIGGPVSRSADSRTFFFAAYEHQRVRAMQSVDFAVPTLTQRQGFSAGFNCPQGGLGSRGVFGCTVSPRLAATLYPSPNHPAGVFGGNTLTSILPAGAEGDLVSLKLDRQLQAWRRSHVLTARYSFANDDTTLPVTGRAIASSLRPLVQVQDIATFFNSTLSPSLANSFRFGWGHTSVDPRQAPTPGFIPSDFTNYPFLLNVPNAYPGMGLDCSLGKYCQHSESYTGPVGQIFMAGFSPIGVDTQHFPQTRVDNTQQFGDTLTWIRGRHHFFFGTEFWDLGLSGVVDRGFRPSITYALTMTGAFAPPVVRQTFTQINANPSLENVDSRLAFHDKQWDGFIQDNIRIASNLQINAGLRLAFTSLPRSDNGQFERDFDSTTIDARNALSVNLCAGQIVYCPLVASSLRAAYPPGYYQAFGTFPLRADGRLGFSWDPFRRGKTAVRGGWGSYSGQLPPILVNETGHTFPRYIPLEWTSFPFDPSDVGITNANGFQYPLRSGYPFNRFAPQTMQDPVQLLASDHFWPGGWGVDLTEPGKSLSLPRSQQFGLTLEQEIHPGLVASLAYVGTLGNNLLRQTQPLGASAQALQSFNLYNTASVCTRIAAPNCNVLPVAQTYLETTASSSYHSLQASIRGGQGNAGLHFGAAFTYAHSIDDASDFFDLAGSYALPQNGKTPSERGSSSFDSRFRFASHFLWEPPFAQAHRLLRSWQLSGIFIAQSGQPYTVNTAVDVNNDGALTDRLNIAPAAASGDRRVLLVKPVNTGSLLAAAGKDGALGRNTFRGPGLLQLDLGIGRGIRITEGRELLLRMDAFNVPNRTNFGLPVRTLEAVGFGSSVTTAAPNRTLQATVKFRF